MTSLSQSNHNLEFGISESFILRSCDMSQADLFALSPALMEVFPETEFRQIQYHLPPGYVHLYEELSVTVRSITGSLAAAYVGKKIVDVVADLMKQKLLAEKKPDHPEKVLTLYDHRGNIAKEIIIPGRKQDRTRFRHTHGQE